MEVKKILVTTDFSDYSRVAFPYAVDLARKYSSEIIIFHVIEPIIAPADFAWGSYNTAEIEQKTREYAEQALEKIKEEWIPSDMVCHKQIGFGNPFKEIIQFSKENDIGLIVISTHGLTGLSHVIFGSTTEKVVRKSSVPVLTVRDPSHNFEMP